MFLSSKQDNKHVLGFASKEKDSKHGLPSEASLDSRIFISISKESSSYVLLISLFFELGRNVLILMQYARKYGGQGLRTRVAAHGLCCFYQLSYRLLPFTYIT
jgi:hypothetical protein